MKTKPIIKNFLTRAAMTLGERITRPFTVMLLMLMTTATAWAAQPVGCLDACTGGEELIHIQGWAYDPDYPAQSLPLYVFIYTDEACTKSYDVNYNHSADVPRPDVNEAKGITGNHGFNFDIPIADAGTYWVKIFTISINQDGNLQIGPITKVTVTAGPSVVTVGDGTNVISSLPLHTLANSSWTQQIYTAEEIGRSGTISSIAFNYAYSEPFSMEGVQVYLKHTNWNVFVDRYDMVQVGEEDKVFEGTFSATGAGWVKIEFDTPFEYNGTSNLLVCCLDPTDGKSAPLGFYYSYTDINSKRSVIRSTDDGIIPWWYNDSFASIWYYGRNNIRFTFPSGGPDNLTLNSCTDEKATLTWTAPPTLNPITGYSYQFKKTSDAYWSDEVTTTGTSATVSNLTADTDYDFRVKVLYDNDASVYAYIHFTTAPALPYEMGFEENMGRWSMVDCDANWDDTVEDIWGTGRRKEAAYNGNVGFQFGCYDEGNKIPQYLISSRVPDDKAITMSFYYRVPTGIAETIYVGYSTTTNDMDAFTFGDAITCNSSTWTRYEHTFPAGARYFAVKYASNEYMMYIDEFSFEESSTYAKPTTIGNTTVSETEATIVWNVPEGATGVAYQYKKASDAAWSAEATLSTNTVTLSGLTPNTNYDFRVKALYGSNASNYATCRFLTEANMVDLPYTDGFENGMGGWRMINCGGMTKIWNVSSPHSGTYSFLFEYAGQYQYLISPHFAGGMPTKVLFYYSGRTNNSGVFSVGYTSSKEADPIWVDNAVIANTAWTLYETTIPAEAQYLVICCHKESEYLYLDDFSFTGPIVLADDADNTTAISDAASLGEPCNIRLGGRTLYRDGDWNTLTVPFNMSNFDGTPLEGATVKTLSSTAFSNGTLTLNFEDVTSIEAGKPYIVKWDDGANVTINSTDDWNVFAEAVNGGKSYAGKNVLLGADIDVSTMVGTAEHPFRGIFEGAGHTLNVSISDGGDGAAPFHYISGATIRNVKTTGTVSGGNHSAGLVGVAQGGTNSIRDCYVAATVSTSGSYVGGILGNGTTSTTTISNCLFGGNIAASNMGILYGWGENGGTHTVENCVANGNYSYGGSIDLLLANGTKTVTNCWKNKDVGSQGDNSTYIYTSGTHPLVSGYLGSQWTYENNNFVLSPTVNIVGTNIVNPVFKNVTIDATAPAPVAFDGGTFTGTYSPLDSTTGLLFDEHNPSNGACRAYLNIDAPALDGFDGWYTDAEITTPVSTIPFDADGTVKLYAKLAGSQQLVGDANGDGKVDAADIVEMVNAMNGNVSTNFNWDNADFDGNHTITDYDINEVVKIIMGE